jgi:transcriptional regulator with XRE-family HTH domain
LKSLRKQFGQRIRQIRGEMRKSQEDFAEILGMSVDFLSLIERGRNSPSFPKLERMARGLNKPVAYLFDFEKLFNPQQKYRQLR